MLSIESKKFGDSFFCDELINIIYKLFTLKLSWIIIKNMANLKFQNLVKNIVKDVIMNILNVKAKCIVP